MATDYIVPEPEHPKENNLEPQPLPDAAAEAQSLEAAPETELGKTAEIVQEKNNAQAAVPVLPSIGRPGEPMTERELADLGLDPSLASNPQQLDPKQALNQIISSREVKDATAASDLQEQLLR